MELSEFVKFRSDLVEEKRKISEEIDKRYNEAADKFIEANNPVKWGDVYELADQNERSVNQPKNSKRFVVYTEDIRWMKDNPIIICGIWWLNEKTNVPQKWDTITTFGTSNIVKVVRSENQTNHDHPDSKEE